MAWILLEADAGSGVSERWPAANIPGSARASLTSHASRLVHLKPKKTHKDSYKSFAEAMPSSGEGARRVLSCWAGPGNCLTQLTGPNTNFSNLANVRRPNPSTQSR